MPKKSELAIEIAVGENRLDTEAARHPGTRVAIRMDRMMSNRSGCRRRGAGHAGCRRRVGCAGLLSIIAAETIPIFGRVTA